MAPRNLTIAVVLGTFALSALLGAVFMYLWNLSTGSSVGRAILAAVVVLLCWQVVRTWRRMARLRRRDPVGDLFHEIQGIPPTEEDQRASRGASEAGASSTDEKP